MGGWRRGGEEVNDEPHRFARSSRRSTARTETDGRRGVSSVSRGAAKPTAAICHVARRMENEHIC